MIRAGVVGSPAKHSLSPLIHTAWLKAARIDGQYSLYDIEKDGFPAFLQQALDEGLRGVNVTLPFKEQALNAADEARTRRRRHAIEILGRDFGPCERAGDERVDDLDMGARRNLRHNAPERRVRGDLAHHFVGKDFAGAIGSQPHDRRRRFVAGCLNAENAHV